MEKELENLFLQRVESIKNNDLNERKRVYEINLKYAEAYISLVKDVISGMQSFNKPEDIKVRNKIIGNYYIKGEHEYTSSNAIMTDEGLDIILNFNDYEKRSVEREKEYDEEILNEILKKYNISVNTRYDDGGGMFNTHIKISYVRRKSLDRRKIKK